MSEKKKRQPLPHTRRVVRKRHGSIDSEATFEVRGTRNYSSALYKGSDGSIDLSLTTVEAKQSDQNASNVFARLFEAANSLLQAAGEKTYLEARDWLSGIANEDHNATQMQDLALLLWQSDIANRKGTLSPEATAARFLWLADQIRSKIDEKHQNAILGFADAWHWWHLEESGEHEASFRGKVSSANLSRAAPKAAERRSKRVLIVREEAHSWRAAHPNERYHQNASALAGKILDAVNARLKADKEHPYTIGTLEKIVGKHVIGPRRARSPNARPERS